MGYPAKWQPFLRDVFLTSEGGYVKTGSLETLFGVIDRVWVDALDRVPQAEINAQPEPSRRMLNDIRALPENKRMGPVREWMRMVGRETDPMGNGKQPESGIPLRSKEWAEEGGNKALVHHAQELALGIIHRDYIVGGHFEYLPLSQQTLCTVIDAAGRYGVAAAWTMVTKSARLSGYITERQMNELGYTESKDMREGDTYGKDGGGKNYTIVSRRKDVGEAMKLMHDGEMDSRFFDAYGFWRRNYVNNHTPENERAGDNQRVDHQHGNPSAARERMAAWRTDVPPNAAMADARIAARNGGLVKETGQLANAASAASSTVSVALGPPQQATEVYVQNAKEWLGSPQLALDIPGHGVIHYSLLERSGYIRADGSEKFERGDVMVLDKVINKPEGVYVVRPGKQALGITNGYTDATILVWKDADGKVQPLVLTPEMHRSALAVSMRYEWGGLAYADDFATKVVDGQVRLDPNGSATLNFGKGRGALTQAMVFIEHPAGEAPRSGLEGNMQVTEIVDPKKAAQTNGPLASR